MKVLGVVGGRLFITMVAALTVGAASLSAVGCAEVAPDGGLNQNNHFPGDEPGGVQLGEGDIAVSPDGNYVVFRKDDKLAVGWTKTGAIYELPVERPGRLSFSQQRDVVYVASMLGDETLVAAVDISEKATLWSAPLPEGDDMFIAASEDDSRVVAAVGRHMFVLNSADGQPVGFHSLKREIIDLDLVGGAEPRAMLMTDHELNQGPVAELAIVDLDNADKRSVTIPNCADKLTITADGSKALMAPRRCQADPISVIDLTPGSEFFVKNLPGFGPVAVSPDDDVAVGFLDLQQLDPTLFDGSTAIPSAAEARFHLMVLDTADLSYEFYPFGDSMPRYALTPDGDVLLVDNAIASGGRLFDVESGSFRTIDGPLLKFNNFSVNHDSSRAYLLNRMSSDSDALSLVDLDLKEATAGVIDTGFSPRNINIAPNGATLFLRVDTENICVFSLATNSCEQNITVGGSQL